MLKAYLQFILVIGLGVGIYGFLCPYLISSNDTALNLMGVSSLILSVPLFYWLCKKQIKTLYTQAKAKINENL